MQVQTIANLAVALVTLAITTHATRDNDLFSSIQQVACINNFFQRVYRYPNGACNVQPEHQDKRGDQGASFTDMDRLFTVSRSTNPNVLFQQADRASPREISNLISDEKDINLFDERGLSQIAMQWGQFVDHDLAVTAARGKPEAQEFRDIAIPKRDAVMAGQTVIKFARSAGYEENRSLNIVTHFVDASTVYGSFATTTPVRGQPGLAELRRGAKGKHLMYVDSDNLPIFENNAQDVSAKQFGTEDANVLLSALIGQPARLVRRNANEINLSIVEPESFVIAETVQFESESAAAAAAEGGCGYAQAVLARDRRNAVAGKRTLIAGDVRAAVSPGLGAMHSMFVREHNRVADQIHDEIAKTRKLEDKDFEFIFQTARRVVEAEVQYITYEEWLPAITGQQMKLKKYNHLVEPEIRDFFSSAGLRFGHTLVASNVKIVNKDHMYVCGQRSSVPKYPQDYDTVSLGDGVTTRFFEAVSTYDEYGGIEPVVLGQLNQPAMKVDTIVNSAMRNHLFRFVNGDPNSSDIVSRNLQRGRDHGLPTYTQLSKELRGVVITKWDQMSSDKELINRMKQVYSDVTKVDLFIGMLAEDHQKGSSVGPLLSAILIDQFSRLQEGDRLFYTNIDENLSNLRNDVPREFQAILRRMISAVAAGKVTFRDVMALNMQDRNKKVCSDFALKHLIPERSFFVDK